MSREIKFRAWDESKRRFVVETDMVHVSLEGHISHCSESGISKRNDLFLVRYTGFKDKNGVEIYEGDVVRPARAMTAIRVVGFSHGQFTLKGSALSLYGEYSINDGLEVIGNIYENPELLGSRVGDE